jgi:hypothetical protein
MKEIYQALFVITEDETEDIDTRLRQATQFQRFYSYKFIFSIHVWYEILSLVNVAGTVMQNPTCDVGKITENVDYVIKELKTCRSDHYFENIISTAKEVASD